MWKLLNLTSGDVSTWGSASEISEIVYVGSEPTSILYLNGSNAAGDGVSLYTSDVSSPDSAKLVASLSGDFSGLKAAETKSGDIHFLLYSKAYPNGTAYSEATAVTPRSTGRLYDAIYARHWVGIMHVPLEDALLTWAYRTIGCQTSSRLSLAVLSPRAGTRLGTLSAAI